MKVFYTAKDFAKMSDVGIIARLILTMIYGATLIFAVMHFK